MKMKSSTRSLLPILITITVILANFSLLYIPYQSHANAAVVDSQAQDPDPNPPTEVATEAPTEAPTEVATDTPTEVATEVPTEVATEVATEAPTEVATEMPTEAPTEVATETPTEVATEAPTETPTETPPEGPGMSLMGASPLGGPMGPMPMGASGSSCELQITDAGDADPLTFEFTAIGTGIASYAWDFENDGTTDATVAGPVVHSYPAPAPGPDTYTVKLTCTPASDPDIVLYGMVTVGGGTVPIASFSVSSDWGVGTLSFSTTNNTIPTTGLDYLWEVTGPENYTSTEFEPGFALGTVGTYTVKLTASPRCGLQLSTQHGNGSLDGPGDGG
jgi:hypothetical protein